MKITITKGQALGGDTNPEKKVFDEDKATLIDRLISIIESKEYKSLRAEGFSIGFDFDESEDLKVAESFYDDFIEKLIQRDNAPKRRMIEFQQGGKTLFILEKQKIGYESHKYVRDHEVSIFEPITIKPLPVPSNRDPKQIKKSMAEYNPVGNWGR
jgi:hypothetical protein